jgi:hypothetical protein
MARSSSEGGRDDRPRKLEATKRKVLGWNKFVDLVVGGIGPIPALVWVVLYRHATAGIVTRSNSLLAKDVGVSRETIKRAITTLRKEKLLRVVRQGGMHVGPTTYRLGVRDLRGSAATGSAADEGGIAGGEGSAESDSALGAAVAGGTVTEAAAIRVVDSLKVPETDPPTESLTTPATR